MEIKYVAIDGREFKTKEECEEYESKSSEVIDAQFEALPLQKSHGFADETCFGSFSYDDDMYAVKIENANQLEIVNKWIHARNSTYIIGADKIGTIQLLDIYGNDVWVVGTPAEFKERCCKDIDTFFDKLIKEGE